MALPKVPVISFAHLPDQELIDAFINAPLTTAKALIKEPEQKLRFWQLLEKNANNPKLTSAYQKVEQVLGVIPTLQTQPQPAAAPAQEIPTVTTKEFVAPEIPQQPTTPEILVPLEKEMNQIKHNYQDFYYADLAKRQYLAHQQESLKQQQEFKEYLAQQSAHAAAQNYKYLLENLKARIFPYLVNESLKTSVLEALGPLGQAFRALEAGKAKLHPSYKNILLNPDAVHYYLRSLPEQGAFKLMMLPFRTGLTILAYGGGPFTKVVRTEEPTWNEKTQTFQNRVVTKTVFKPFLQFANFGNNTANYLDKLSGWDTTTSFTEDRQRLYHAQEIDEKLKLLREAKKDYLSSRIIGDEFTRRNAELNLKKTKKELNKQFGDILLDHDGFFRIFKDKHGNPQWSLSDVSFWERLKYSNELMGGVFRACFKKALTKTARNFRRTERDPLTYLAFLIGNLVWDLTAGLAANIVKAATTRVLSNIPGFNLLRAQIQAFFGTEKFMTFGRMGLTNINHVFRGGFSLETASSGYLGYKLGSLFTPNLYFNLFGLPVNIGGALTTPIFAGGGAFYKTALLHATAGPFLTTPTGIISLPGLGPVPQIVQWTNQYIYGTTPVYRSAFGFQRAVYIPVDPVRGSRIWNETELEQVGYKYFKGWAGAPGPIARFGAWLWRHPYFRLPIKGLAFGTFFAPVLQQYFGISPWITVPTSIALDYLWQIKGVLASDLGYALSQTTFGRAVVGVYLDVQNWITERIWQPIQFEASLAGKMPVKWGLRPWANTVSKYLGNFLNPGFFAGFSLIHPLIMAGMNPFLAAVFGPVAGASFSLLYGRGLIGFAQTVGIKSIGGISIAGKLGLNALPQINAWSWLGMGIGTVIDLILPGSQVWLTIGLTYGLPFALTLFPALAAFLGNLLTGVLAIGQWLIYSIGVFGFGIPATAIASGLAAVSVFVSIATVTGLVIFTGFIIYSAFWVPMLAEWRAQPTSTNFSIQTDVTQTGPNKYRLCAKFDVTQHILNSLNYLDLTMDFEDSQLTVNLSNPANTTSASRDSTGLEYVFDCSSLTSSDYCIPALPTPPSIAVGAFQEIPILKAYLSVPPGSKDSIDNLMLTNPGLANSIIPFLQILQEMAKDKLNPEGYTAYFVQGQEELQSLLNQQKTVLKSLQQKVAAGELADAKQYLDSQLSDNPVKDPEDIICSETNARCLEYKKTVKGLYDSWPKFTNQKLNSINNLIADPTAAKLAEAAASLEGQFTETEQMWENQKQLVNKLNEISHSTFGISEADSLILTDPDINIRDFAHLPEDVKQKLWEILTNYFSEIFNLTKKYFYVPQGTNYTFCADADYCLNNFTDPPSPADCSPVRPQTVCSSIYALTNNWIGSAFAKHCVTFTPQ